MEARVFFYTGIDPDKLDDEQLIRMNEKIMFCLIENGTLTNE